MKCQISSIMIYSLKKVLMAERDRLENEAQE